MTIEQDLNASPDDLARSEHLRQAIIEEMKELPGGLMTFGRFAELSIYGCGPELHGYYTNHSFSPNDVTTIDNADSIGTLAAYGSVGNAIGEIAADELVGFIEGSHFNLIEVGGGNGTLMVNMLAGAAKRLRQHNDRHPLQPVSIDRVPQLLERQRRAVTAAAAKSRRIADPVFIHARIEDVTGPLFPSGVVVSNELLDMLPFEVAVRQTDASVPQLLYVEYADGLLLPVRADAPEELFDEVEATLKRYPQHTLHSFQPRLIETMGKLTSLVETGTIITLDYRPNYEPDVQILRNGVTNARSEHFNFPGLFDISVVPDWQKISRWAISRYGEDCVELELMSDFLEDTDTFAGRLRSLADIVLNKRPGSINNAMIDMMISQLGDNYAALTIRK